MTRTSRIVSATLATAGSDLFDGQRQGVAGQGDLVPRLAGDALQSIREGLAADVVGMLLDGLLEHFRVGVVPDDDVVGELEVEVPSHGLNVADDVPGSCYLLGGKVEIGCLYCLYPREVHV